MGNHCTNSILSALPLLLILQVFLPVYSQISNCQTPNGVNGDCIELNQCDELYSILTERRTASYAYLRRSQCDMREGNPWVCCPLPPIVVGKSGGKNPLLPQICGLDSSQRIVGGEIADVFEHPWMALLEYVDTWTNVTTTACGGALISKRYVMTAAHCVKGKDLPKRWNLVNVRLGEYDTSTERDCIPDGDGTSFCTPDPVTVGIEEKIVHQRYRPRSADQVNDIALLRLNRDVAFGEFIQPICLPQSDTLNDTFLHVSGWGKTETRSESAIKLKLKVPVANNTQCTNAYASIFRLNANSQICAGGEKDRDSCRGDSGGPLMSVKTTSDGRKQWTVVGIVSLGPARCGTENWPGVYTKVPHFAPWIDSNMRA